MKRLLQASGLALGLASAAHAQTAQVQQLPVAQTPLAPNTAFWCAAQLPSGAWRTYNCLLSAITSGTVQTFSGGATGLTPNVATGGVVTLGGILSTGYGGTGSATQNFVDLTTTQASIAGAKTFAGQLIGKGTATNDSAAAGYIGEFTCSQVTNGGSPSGCATNSSTPVSMSYSTNTNIANISLTAGDWDVASTICFHFSGVGAFSGYTAGISSTSATMPTAGASTAYTSDSVGYNAAVTDQCFPIGTERFSLTGSTTVFLVGFIAGSGGTVGGYGKIEARRSR